MAGSAADTAWLAASPGLGDGPSRATIEARRLSQRRLSARRLSEPTSAAQDEETFNRADAKAARMQSGIMSRAGQTYTDLRKASARLQEAEAEARAPRDAAFAKRRSLSVAATRRLAQEQYDQARAQRAEWLTERDAMSVDEELATNPFEREAYQPLVRLKQEAERRAKEGAAARHAEVEKQRNAARKKAADDSWDLEVETATQLTRQVMAKSQKKAAAKPMAAGLEALGISGAGASSESFTRSFTKPPTENADESTKQAWLVAATSANDGAAAEAERLQQVLDHEADLGHAEEAAADSEEEADDAGNEQAARERRGSLIAEEPGPQQRVRHKAVARISLHAQPRAPATAAASRLSAGPVDDPRDHLRSAFARRRGGISGVGKDMAVIKFQPRADTEEENKARQLEEEVEAATQKSKAAAVVDALLGVSREASLLSRARRGRRRAASAPSKRKGGDGSKAKRLDAAARRTGTGDVVIAAPRDGKAAAGAATQPKTFTPAHASPRAVAGTQQAAVQAASALAWTAGIKLETRQAVAKAAGRADDPATSIELTRAKLEGNAKKASDLPLKRREKPLPLPSKPRGRKGTFIKSEEMGGAIVDDMAGLWLRVAPGKLKAPKPPPADKTGDTMCFGLVSGKKWNPEAAAAWALAKSRDGDVLSRGRPVGI